MGRTTIINVAPRKDGLEVGITVECRIGSSTVTVGSPYKVRGIFDYSNWYGNGINRYRQVDTFITLKNDSGYTVKMNFRKFKLYVRPEMTLEERVAFLENKLNSKGIIITK